MHSTRNRRRRKRGVMLQPDSQAVGNAELRKEDLDCVHTMLAHFENGEKCDIKI